MEAFACQLEEFLDQELKDIGDSSEATKQDRFCVHKACFESLIDQHSAYKDLLSNIKAEYEECIAAIERGQREVAYLSRKLASDVLEPGTLRNYTKRRNELELRVELLRMDNLRLESRLKPSRTSDSQKKSYLRFFSKSQTPASDGSRWSLRHPHVSWTIEQLTDTAFLTKKVYKDVVLEKREELKMQIMALKLSLTVEENKFNLSSRRNEGEGAFSNIAKALKETQETMVKADELCEEDENDEPDDKRGKSYFLTEIYRQSSLQNFGDDDDPRSDREAEFILEYIENFSELFATGKVEEAVLLAAHSPKGSLRTPETLERLKEYDAVHSDSSVCLSYWEALLPTVSTGCAKPSEWESNECVKCVLDEGRMDLLTHWIAQNQLTLSKEVGQLIQDACQCTESCVCGLIGLAEAVFENAGAYKEVASCLAQQGRFQGAVDYTENSPYLTTTDLAVAFHSCQFSDRVFTFLTTECIARDLLSIEQIVSVLVHKTNNLDLVEEYIMTAVKSGYNVCVSEMLRPGMDYFGIDNFNKWVRLSERFEELGLQQLAEDLLPSAVVSHACYRGRVDAVKEKECWARRAKRKLL